MSALADDIESYEVGIPPSDPIGLAEHLAAKGWTKRNRIRCHCQMHELMLTYRPTDDLNGSKHFESFCMDVNKELINR